MAISRKQVHPGKVKSRAYSAYHGITGSSRMGGTMKLKHPKGRKAGKHKAKSGRY